MHHTNVPFLNTILDYLDTLPHPIASIIELSPILLLIFLMVYFSTIRPSRKEKELKAHKNSYENASYSYLDPDATIVDVSTEEYRFSKTDKGFKTVVTFSDGFKYLSTDVDYDIHITYATYSVDKFTKMEIMHNAIESHDKAYEKLYGVASREKNLETRPCLWFCKKCADVYSGKTGNKRGVEVCPKCNKKLYQTVIPVENWETLSEENKKKYKMGFLLGYGLKISDAYDRFPQSNKSEQNNYNVANKSQPINQESGNESPEIIRAQDTIFCRKCGAKIPSDSVFCPKCGGKVVKE